ncbi:hypothetical protein OIU77_027485 [Salix suchowensis]|uniref:Uncharacterized protein n=1 Tax=Salix suchowensis TaxID=1278906 RepID=A0ABQ9BSK7_9ROSI|nr:hypothetical protein OIU77_027485 [Salix suchowensis]
MGFVMIYCNPIISDTVGSNQYYRIDLVECTQCVFQSSHT